MTKAIELSRAAIPTPWTGGVPAIVADEYRELHELPTERLREELSRALHLSAAYLRRLAVIVRLIEERGEDLSELKLDLLPYLRLIAHGQLLPELLVRHGQSPLLIRIAKSLPLPDQDRLARGEHVPLVVRRPDGSFDHRMADPGMMGRDQLTQVFSMGRIRSIEEQILVMEARGHPRERKAANRAADRAAKARPDRERGGIVVGRTFVPLADVVEALAALRGSPDDDDDETEEDGEKKGVMIHLSAAQHDRLRKAAYDGRTKIAPLVRRALIAYGLI